MSERRKEEKTLPGSRWVEGRRVKEEKNEMLGVVVLKVRRKRERESNGKSNII